MERPKHPEDLKGKQGSTSGPLKRSTKGNWTPEEDEVLREAVEHFKGKNWKKIAECLKDRTDTQCRQRWRYILKPDVVKGPWSEEEDNKLIALVQRHGQQWSNIAKLLPGRIGKQCSERWQNHLDPEINKNAWTKEEELTLIRAHKKYGNKWAELMKYLPRRSANSIKNHWNSSVSVKKMLDSYHASSPSDQCQSLPLTAFENESIAASSSRMHISGDEDNSRPEVDAEVSEGIQASTVFSQSTNDVPDEPNPGNEIYKPKYHSGAEQQISSTASHAEPCNPSFDDVNPKIPSEAACSKNDQLQGVSNDAKQDLDLDLLTPKPDDNGKNQSLVRLGDQPFSVILDTDQEIEIVFTDEDWSSFLGNDDDDDGITEQQELSYIPKESSKLVPPNSLSSPSRANKISFPTEDKPAEKDKRALSYEPSSSPSAVDPSFDNKDDHVPANDDFYHILASWNDLNLLYYGEATSVGLDDSDFFPTMRTKNDQLQGVSHDAKQDLDLDLLLTHTMDDNGTKNQALKSLVRLGDQPSSPNLDTDPETETVFTDEELRSFFANDDDDDITDQQELPKMNEENNQLRD